MAEQNQYDDRQIEELLSQSVAKITPDAFDAVLANLGTQQKGVQLTMTDPKTENIQTTKKTATPRTRIFARIAAVAAALILLLGGAAGGSYYANHKVVSTAMLDVNPSVEIALNRNDRVLRVNALNSDGEVIIGQMEFAGQTLEMTVNALIGSMLRNGYLSDVANSILISVDSGDAQRAETLQKQISDAVLEVLGDSSDVSGAVLSQTLSKDAELQALADEYGISLGKAQLIRQITAQNSLYTFAELVPLTVNELNLISESGALENVNVSGPASDKAYIGEARAKALALAAIGATEANVTGYQCEMEYKRSVMVYEIECDFNGKEYEIAVNALTGEIVQRDEEALDGRHPGTTETPGTTEAPGTYLDEARAKEIVLADAGVAEGDITGYRLQSDWDNGIREYEIEFYAKGYEYEYTLNAATGDILKKETGATASGGGTGAAEAYIGEAKAKEIALAHAGVSADSALRMECKLEREDGTMLYEISFDAGGYEYDYEVDAITGSILKYDKERD